MNEHAALRLDGVSAGYGAFRALFDVSLDVRAGTATALLGPNGAGKTTLARVCSGLMTPTAGRVLLDGGDITGEKPSRIARRGLIHLNEGRSVFSDLSIEENLTIAFGSLHEKENVQPALDRAYDAFPRLGERRRQRAGTLSGGEQRMLTLARVLAAPPRVVIADELSLGLAPVVVEEVYGALEQLRDTGTTLLVVEQHVHRALALADEVVLLAKGRVSWAGPAANANDRVEELLPDAVAAESNSN